MNNDNPMETERNDKIIIKTEAPVSLDDLCRVCAKTSDRMIPIFNNDFHQSLSAKMNEYLPINITENDTLPLQSCYTCAVMILSWHDLSEECLRAQQKLSQIQSDTIPQFNEVNKIGLGQNIQNEVAGTSSTSELEKEQYENLLLIKQLTNETVNNQRVNDQQFNTTETNDLQQNTRQKDVAVNENDIENLKHAKNLRKIKNLVSRAQIIVNNQIIYNCKKCRKHFPTPYLFTCHLKSHIREKLHKCHICKQQFSLKHNLIRHLNQTHSKIRKLLCDICNKMCDYKERMNASEQQSYTAGCPFVCESCKYTHQNIFTPSTIYNTMNTVDEDCPVQCTHCQKFLPTKSSLRYHMVEHVGESSNNLG